MRAQQVDVVVVGAGTAGAAAAGKCARAGLSVICLDVRRLERAGPRWSAWVPRWCFHEAQVDEPSGEELLGAARRVHTAFEESWLAKPAAYRIITPGGEVIDVDLRLLAARLQREARSAGAALLGRVRIGGWDGKVLETSAGSYHPRYLVDASGLGGARLLRQPSVKGEDICVALQQVNAVADVPALEAFHQRQNADVGDGLAFTGCEGPYSTLTLRWDGAHLSLLAGTVPAAGHPSPARLLGRFCDDVGFVGERLWGGARAIPIRRPFDRLAVENVATLGDAAGQVFPPHGSGVGQGLVAAELLARALADGRGPAGYAADYQRRHGGVLAGYDMLRRFVTALPPGTLRRLAEAGLTTPKMVRHALEQRPPALDPDDLPKLARGLLHAPALAAKLAPLTLRSGALRAFYATYPGTAAAIPRWQSWLHALGVQPDPFP